MNKLDQEYLNKLYQKIQKCPKCFGRNLTCSCYKGYFFELAKIEANIPTKFRNFTLANVTEPDSQKIVKKISKYLEKLRHYRKKGVGLYLFGNPGTCKTGLGCIVLMEALKLGYSGYVTTVVEYINLLTKNFDEESGIVRKISDVDFLLIDDVGREYQDEKGFVSSRLEELIRYRADNLLPTIITSNKDELSLAENNFRFLSLLQEHFIPIRFATKDYRKVIREGLKREENEVS